MIKLTARQRVNIEGIVRAKRWKDEDDAVMFAEILAKIRIPKEAMASIVKPMPDGTALVDDRALAAIPDLEVELDRSESRKLGTRLREWRDESGITVDDSEWFVPLRKQLES